MEDSNENVSAARILRKACAPWWICGAGSLDRDERVTTQDITCDNGMPAFLAYPSGGGSFPTVILMHERYGLVQHTRDQAIRCARDGFAVLSLNFFFRHPDQAALNAGNSRYDLTDPESVELIKASLTTLKNHPAADLDKVVVAGYCQTGRHPLIFAAEVPISAAVVWYGAAASAATREIVPQHGRPR
jgi:carboxymethylenebutenolidase